MKLANIYNNPVVSMEFRLRMRSKKTPWIISLYLLVMAAIIFAYIYLQTQNMGYFDPNRSRELFIILSFIQFTMLSFVTPGLTSGAISGEREKQTLNILLTTNLSPTRIIIGKWFSTLSFMMLLIIATLPLYSIVFLYGGISPVQLAEVFGIYIVSMLAIGSVGVLMSTLIKRTGVATVLTYGIIIAYTVITLLIPQMIQSYYYSINRSNPQQLDWLGYFYSVNPFYALMNVFESYSPGYQGLILSPYWLFILFFTAVTIISMLLAIYFIKPVRKKLFKR